MICGVAMNLAGRNDTLDGRDAAPTDAVHTRAWVLLMLRAFAAGYQAAKGEVLCLAVPAVPA
jgi:hypothetical protein